jgi:hypothetical protein
MKAITVWEPWASLIAAGHKPYEFRPWHPPASMIHKRIAIHAAKRPIDRAEVEAIARDPKHYNVKPEGVAMLQRFLADEDAIPYSAIVCTAGLGRPIKCTELWSGPDINPRMWAWPMVNIEPVIPVVSAVGKQRFWEWER